MASQGAQASAAAKSMATTTQQTSASAPVEMDTLPSSSEESHPVDRVDPAHSMAQPAPEPETAPAPATSQEPTEQIQLSSQSRAQAQSQPAPMTRKQTEALGPATEGAIGSPTSTGSILSINLMLTTGQRHPYRIDEKYLKSRNTEATSSDGTFDPLALSGYKLKELIWTDWRSEWEPRPTAPGSIRLIILGKMVDDKKMLSDYNFNLKDTNVVHMTVKPADFDQDDEGAGAKHHGKSGSIRVRDGGEGGAGCRYPVFA